MAGAVLRNTRTAVSDPQLEVLSPSMHADVDLRIRGGARVLARIVHEVEEYLLDRR